MNILAARGTLVREALPALIGREPTDVAVICCDEQEDRLLFIGIPGGSYKNFPYNTAPNGKARLSLEIMSLYSRLDGAIRAAVSKGGKAAQENDSKGYALINDSKARALQIAVRNYAIRNERELRQALEFSSDVQHRRVASDALVTRVDPAASYLLWCALPATPTMKFAITRPAPSVFWHAQVPGWPARFHQTPSSRC